VCVIPRRGPRPLKGAPTGRVDMLVRYDAHNMKRVNQYTVLKDLRPCAIGIVTLVLDARRQQFAMRTCQRRYLPSSVRLASEITFLKRVSHENVVRLHDVVDDLRHPDVFLIFEHADEGPLMRINDTGIAADGPLTDADTRRFFPQILAGLAHLHQHSVAHGDLHPGNLLLDRSRSTVRLSDYRLAQLFRPPPPLGANPMFVAPEVLRDGAAESCNGFLTDMWALGVTLYTMLWGYVPWRPITDLVTLQGAIQYQAFVFLHAERLEESLLLLLTRLLERDVGRRMTLAQAQASPWPSSAPSPPRLDHRPSDPADSGRTRVLIVEDVSLLRKMLVRMFVSVLKDPDAMEVNTVASEVEALRECRRRSYTLVLMDVHRSRVKWGEISQGIRDHEREQSLPNCNIVGLAAGASEEVRSGCLKAGMAVLCKPLVVSTLRELCVRYGIEVAKTSSKSSVWMEEVSNALSSCETTRKGDARSPLLGDQARGKTEPEAAVIPPPKTIPDVSAVEAEPDPVPPRDPGPLPEARAPESGVKDPKQASLAMMARTRKGRRVPFSFVEVDAERCEPWALGCALREVRAGGVSLDASQSMELRAAVVAVLECPEFRPREDCPKVELPALVAAVKAGIAPFLQSARKRPRVPHIEIYGHSDQGVRASMEDTWCVVENLRSVCGKDFSAEQPDDVFVGVYDGHTGREAAEFACDHLHHFLINHPAYETDLPKALDAAFRETDKEFILRAPGSEAGTTATTVLIRGSKLFVSNAGDGRVVLCHGGQALSLNKLHRPEDAEESRMVQERGGGVYFYNGAWRVNATLSVSRSLGDSPYRDYITCEPEVVVRDLGPEDEFLVVASDGLWDHMNPTEVVGFVRQCRREVDDAKGVVDHPFDRNESETGSMDDYRIVGAALVDAAIQCGSTDNVSCVIVYLPRPPP